MTTKIVVDVQADEDNARVAVEFVVVPKAVRGWCCAMQGGVIRLIKSDSITPLWPSMGFLFLPGLDCTQDRRIVSHCFDSGAGVRAYTHALRKCIADWNLVNADAESPEPQAAHALPARLAAPWVEVASRRREIVVWIQQYRREVMIFCAHMDDVLRGLLRIKDDRLKVVSICGPEINRECLDLLGGRREEDDHVASVTFATGADAERFVSGVTSLIQSYGESPAEPTLPPVQAGWERIR